MDIKCEKYTNPETAMFEALNLAFNWRIIWENCGPMDVYEMAVKDCFVYERTGLVVNTLRDCYIALHYHGKFRSTPEFEEIITNGLKRVLLVDGCECNPAFDDDGRCSQCGTNWVKK